jgi:hypothetical protein
MKALIRQKEFCKPLAIDRSDKVLTFGGLVSNLDWSRALQRHGSQKISLKIV